MTNGVHSVQATLHMSRAGQPPVVSRAEFTELANNPFDGGINLVWPRVYKHCVTMPRLRTVLMLGLHA